jgi:CheY-like chemotaxis protein
MNAILGFSELLRTQMAASRERQYLDAITSSGRTLLTLINDILDLSKIEAGKLELQYEPVCVAKLVEELQKLFSIKAGEKGIVLQTEVDAKLPPGLLLDEVRLRQILFNVVGNAIKFTEKGHVKIRAWVAAGVSPAVEGGILPPGVGAGTAEACRGDRKLLPMRPSIPPGGTPGSTAGETPAATDEPDDTRVDLFLEVEDTGIGIPADQQEIIFGAFAQVSGQSTRKFGGTGLGLAITKRLTEMMHGTVTLQSELGKGSTFRFTFPNVAITELGEQRSAVTETGGDFTQFAPATILVADDIALNRQLVAGYFEGTAHKLVYASTGREAVTLAEQHRPDVILMDMRMPDLSGYEATRLLKANPALKHIPVIAVTASSFREEEARARTLCEGFIRKPFNRAELVAELQRFLKPAEKRETAQAPASTPARTWEPLDAEPERLAIRWPELVARLRAEQEQVWPELCETLELGAVERFAMRVRDLGQTHGSTVVRGYGQSLLEQAQQFDLERLPKTLETFPLIVASIEARVQQAS